ncbi:hypothetical protein Syun_011259 [Stephania yunnanensis]|uniref:PsbP C-terminal domain-containing protein n=1 Tax=Stephania yunnanensis TaxID=152371 RepID=A0AAP0JXX7_9MAGN
MANALLSHPPLLPKNHRSPSKFSIFRNQAKKNLMNREGCSVPEKPHHISCNSSTPVSGNGIKIEFAHLGRRDSMIFGLSSSIFMFFPSSGVFAATELVEDVKMASMVDDINAYSFMYPVKLPSKKFAFKWVESRKPERYSSAAPLSPNARQRIVSERVDIIDNLVISVSIGPSNSQFIKSVDKNSWDAKDVADCVLSDKSALRVTSAQRLAESSILDTHTTKIDGEPYWYYEYLVRKSPTSSAQEPNIYRHYVAATVERDGYLYSLNASTLSKKWNLMGPFLLKTVDSFRLLPPTDNYVPPYKDPWRFW